MNRPPPPRPHHRPAPPRPAPPRPARPGTRLAPASPPPLPRRALETKVGIGRAAVPSEPTRPRPAPAAGRPPCTPEQATMTRAPRRHDSLPPQTDERARRPLREPKRAYAQMDIHPGDTIAARYRVNAIISRSRGLLLDANHTGFEQRVVIRVLSPALVEPKAVAQFEREAQLLSQLQTEHAARILDYGKLSDGSIYLVREYVQGESLAELTRRRGGLPLEEAITQFLQICEAVQEAHSQEVVLRDLQTAHVYVHHKNSGVPITKLTDFGTCKVVKSEGGAGELTATRLLGLSSSACPELVRQEKRIDARGDVWSLGCMLYELLSGRPPFQGDGVALMLAITHDEPAPLSRLRPHLPQVLDQILRWALAKDRDRRFSSVYAFAHELRPFADARGRLLIDQIGRLAHPDGVRHDLAPPMAELMSDRDQELTMVRSLPASSPPAAALPSSRPPAPVVLAPWAEPAAAAPPPSEPAADSGDFPWSTDVPPPANHRGAAAAVWATIVAMPLMALVLTLALSQSDERPLTAHATFSAALSSDLDADAALAAMDPAEPPNEKVEADALEDAVTAMVADERRAEQRRVAAAPKRGAQFLRGIHSGKRGSKKAKKSRRKSKRQGKKKAKTSDRASSSSKAGGNGTLVAMAVGASCSFAVDGASRGRGSSVKASVPAGNHSVSCTPIGGSSRSRSVKVESGKASVTVFRF